MRKWFFGPWGRNNSMKISLYRCLPVSIAWLTLPVSLFFAHYFQVGAGDFFKVLVIFQNIRGM
jgi:hypothetical protein